MKNYQKAIHVGRAAAAAGGVGGSNDEGNVPTRAITSFVRFTF